MRRRKVIFVRVYECVEGGEGGWVRGGKKKGKKNLKNGGKSNKKVSRGGGAKEETFRIGSQSK